MWAMFRHLSALTGILTGGIGYIVGPLIVWQIKKDSMGKNLKQHIYLPDYLNQQKPMVFFLSMDAIIILKIAPVFETISMSKILQMHIY